MNPTAALHALGQSIWLDNITRDMLDDGTLSRYIQDLSVTGLTSNPSIFQKAIAGGGSYQAEIDRADPALDTEQLFNRLALGDLQRAADLLRPAFDATQGADGWVSMEVSPLLADDAQATVEAAAALHAQGARDNLFIKIPGTPAGVEAIEESIFRSIPINVTLLFSPAQCLAATQAWARGVQRRLQAGLDPHVRCVASLFVSRWDVAVQERVPAELRNRLGIAMAQATHRDYRAFLDQPELRQLQQQGINAPRLLWASTGTKDPQASDVLYVEALAAPNTINTLPDKTLLAFANHGQVGQTMPDDGGDCDTVMAACRAEGIDLDALADKLQRDGAAAFVKSWHLLLEDLQAKRPA